jgi:hypothetical protein
VRVDIILGEDQVACVIVDVFKNGIGQRIEGLSGTSSNFLTLAHEPLMSSTKAHDCIHSLLERYSSMALLLLRSIQSSPSCVGPLRSFV